YLTIKKWLRNELVIGYPNEEVRSSLADIYLDDIYRIEGYITLGNDIWKALEDDNTENLVKSYNLAIAGLPYDDFKDRSESWYRSMFVMLLRGAGVIYYAEVHTYKGRPDVVIVFKDKVIVVEFKLAKKSSEVEKKRQEDLEQIKSRDYFSAYLNASSFINEGEKKVINLVLVADDEKRQLVL
ncbi:PD-(D/E)XK nuclease domain-containing protein, partial [bacterium]|nr:PD-(D/E)XK nuclease domain-containing protein [bacterium]